jgi:hypothetical protein
MAEAIPAFDIRSCQVPRQCELVVVEDVAEDLCQGLQRLLVCGQKVPRNPFFSDYHNEWTGYFRVFLTYAGGSNRAANAMLGRNTDAPAALCAGPFN